MLLLKMFGVQVELKQPIFLFPVSQMLSGYPGFWRAVLQLVNCKRKTGSKQTADKTAAIAL